MLLAVSIATRRWRRRVAVLHWQHFAQIYPRYRLSTSPVALSAKVVPLSMDNTAVGLDFQPPTRTGDIENIVTTIQELPPKQTNHGLNAARRVGFALTYGCGFTPTRVRQSGGAMRHGGIKNGHRENVKLTQQTTTLRKTTSPPREQQIQITVAASCRKVCRLYGAVVSEPVQVATGVGPAGRYGGSAEHPVQFRGMS